MNQYQTQVPTGSAPETRFELRPEPPPARSTYGAEPPAPFRAIQETEFERLKNKLLARELAEAPTPGLNAPLRRAANEAAALAWNTQFPLLVFPVLFEEKIGTALHQARRQARIYASSQIPRRMKACCEFEAQILRQRKRFAIRVLLPLRPLRGMR